MAKKNELTTTQWAMCITSWVVLVGALVWALFFRTPATSE
mgnify:FL=1